MRPQGDLTDTAREHVSAPGHCLTLKRCFAAVRARSASLFTGYLPALGWMVGVFAALRAGPGCGAVRVSPDLPAGLVFGAVVAAAAGPEVLRGRVPVGEPEVVIQVAGSGGSVAGREPAGA